MLLRPLAMAFRIKKEEKRKGLFNLSMDKNNSNSKSLPAQASKEIKGIVTIEGKAQPRPKRS